jgi:SsrA-binding protein
MAKVQIALGKGKKLWDKRETIKERDDLRNAAKADKER